jgi:hypothetical protein
MGAVSTLLAHLYNMNFNIILSTTSGLMPLGFPTEVLYAFLQMSLMLYVMHTL